MTRIKNAIPKYLSYVVLFLVAAIVLLPIVWLFVSSFKSDADVISWPPSFWPKEWVFDQYQYVADAHSHI